MYTGRFFILFLFSSFLQVITYAQGTSKSSSNPGNVFILNLGQLFVNEINLGYEYSFSEKNSVELNAGLIYRNEILRKQAENWSNSQYFYEHGFSTRLAYRIYRKAGTESGKRNYYSFGLIYQYLYYNNEWIETDEDITVELEPSGEEVVTKEEIYRHRFRDRLELQLLLGKVIPLSKTFAIEFYYGLGLRGTFSDRFDVARGATVNGEKVILMVLNFEDQKLYFRPAIHAGVKLRIGR